MGFLQGAILQHHLLVVSAAAQAYAVEVEGVSPKGRANMGLTSASCHEAASVEKAVGSHVFLNRGHSVEQMHIAFAVGDMVFRFWGRRGSRVRSG